MSTILLLLDMQNLWNGAREQYGKRARVNLPRVIEKARIKKADKIIVYAFVVLQPDKNQENLIKKLEELGCTVVTKSIDCDPAAWAALEPTQVTNGWIGLTDSMLATITLVPEADTIVVASNDPDTAHVLKAANVANKHTVLMGFSTRMGTALANEADDVRLLSKDDTLIQ